jgi:SAM-dependent methyltransferase
VVFDRVADRYDGTRGGDERGRRAAGEIGAHLREAQLILEVGVGTGLVAAALLAAGHRVVGADLSHAMLARAASRLGSRVCQADALRLPFPDEAVDAVVAVHVLHLVADVEGVLAEGFRVLRAGGTLVATTTERPDYHDAVGALIAPLMARYRPAQDTTDRVAALAGACGFEVTGTHAMADEVRLESASQLAEGLETRLWAWTWEVPEQDWGVVVGPVITALRALPQPDAPRERRIRRDLVVARRPGNGSAPSDPTSP